MSGILYHCGRSRIFFMNEATISATRRHDFGRIVSALCPLARYGNGAFKTIRILAGAGIWTRFSRVSTARHIIFGGGAVSLMRISLQISKL